MDPERDSLPPGSPGLRPSGFERDVRHSAGAQAVSVAVRLASSIALARLLGPTARGEVALALWAPVLFHAACYWSLGEASVAMLTQGRHAREDVLGGLNTLALALIAAGTLAYFGLGGWILAVLKHEIPWRLYALGFALFPINVLWAGWAATHLGLGNVARVNWGRVINQSVLLAGVLVALPWLGREPMVAVAAYVAAAAAELVWVGTALNREIPLRVRWRPAVQREQLARGARMSAAVWTTAASQRLHLVLVNWFGGATGVGFYAIAAGLRDFALLLPDTFVRPVLAEAARDPAGVAFARLGRVMRPALGLMGAAAVALGLILPWAVSWMYSDAFLPAVPAGRWLLAGYVAFGLVNILSAIFIGTGRPGPLVLSQLAALGALVAAAAALGPGGGIAGVAGAICMSQWTALAVLLALTRRSFAGSLSALFGFTHHGAQPHGQA
ncbi:MAG TPA: hypothetical protein VGB20_06545 [bacterium]